MLIDVTDDEYTLAILDPDNEVEVIDPEDDDG